MSEFEYGSEDRRPLMLWNGYPIYSSTLLVVIHVGMLLIWTFVVSANQTEAIGFFSLSTPHVLKGFAWQPLTYALVHPPGSVNQMIWFAIEMYFLWTFGRELERYFGRRTFWKLYVLLWLLAPAVLLSLHWWMPTRSVFGSAAIHFSLFIAFATLYPSATMTFGLSAKWIAVILIAAEYVQDIASHRFTYMAAFTASIVLAHYFVRYEKGELAMPRFTVPRKKPKFRVLPRPSQPAPRLKVAAPVATMDDVDALLDKIARTGLSSLSPSERARLERASADLKKRP